VSLLAEAQIHNIIWLQFQFNGRFSRWTWISRFPLGSSSSICSGIEPLGSVEYGWCRSCHSTISVKALKRTQSTDPNQWPGLILSSSTTRLLMERTLPLYLIYTHNITDTSMNIHHEENCQLFHAQFLWSPYGIGQTITFLPCGFFLSSFFSSPNLSRRRLDVCHTSTHGVALVQI